MRAYVITFHLKEESFKAYGFWESEEEIKEKKESIVYEFFKEDFDKTPEVKEMLIERIK